MVIKFLYVTLWNTQGEQDFFGARLRFLVSAKTPENRHLAKPWCVSDVSWKWFSVSSLKTVPEWKNSNSPREVLQCCHNSQFVVVAHCFFFWLQAPRSCQHRTPDILSFTMKIFFPLFACLMGLIACGATPKQFSPFGEMTLGDIKELYVKLFPPFLNACDLKKYHLGEESPFPFVQPAMNLYWQSSFAPVCDDEEAFSAGFLKEYHFKIKFFVKGKAFQVSSLIAESYLPMLWNFLDDDKFNNSPWVDQARLALGWVHEKLRYHPIVTFQSFMEWVVWELHECAAPSQNSVPSASPSKTSSGSPDARPSASPSATPSTSPSSTPSAKYSELFWGVNGSSVLGAIQTADEIWFNFICTLQPIVFQYRPFLVLGLIIAWWQITIKQESTKKRKRATGRQSQGPSSRQPPPSFVKYNILGVPKHATFLEIKRAYRGKALQFHPDKGGDPELFRKIQVAYEILSDDNARRRYNFYGEDGLKPHERSQQWSRGKYGRLVLGREKRCGYLFG